MFVWAICGVLLTSSVPSLDGHPLSSGNDQVCTTQACQNAGLNLYNSINFSVNPCDDFFDFACGNWIAKNPIKPDETSSGSFVKINKVMQDQIESILTQSKAQDYKSSAIKYALNLYEQCMDEGNENNF